MDMKNHLEPCWIMALMLQLLMTMVCTAVCAIFGENEFHS